MTREKAIKIIKEFISGTCLHTVDQDALETLIPELKENEDERIRKALIEALKTSKTVGELKFVLPEPTREECIAYLEKKKEPVVDKEGMYYYLGGKFIYCGYPATEENPYDFAMSHQDKQKEQKPATNNKSEMSDENGHLTEKILVEYGAHAKVRDGKRHCEMEWKEFQRLAHYFYELGKAEQKPAEYDHEMWKNCEANFEGGKKEVIEHPEKYGLQKPAEWSEEDEKTLVNVIRGELELSESRKEYFVNWLKSLRSRPKASDNWKPSEEMKQNYIRKDALLEWIQEARAIPHENAIVRDLAFQEVVNKINSI